MAGYRFRLLPPRRVAARCSHPGESLKAAATPVASRPSDSPQAAVSDCALSWRHLVACAPTDHGEVNLHAELRNKEHFLLSYCVNRHASLPCRFFARVSRATRVRMPRGARSVVCRPSPRRRRIAAALLVAHLERQADVLRCPNARCLPRFCYFAAAERPAAAPGPKGVGWRAVRNAVQDDACATHLRGRAGSEWDDGGT